jgi:hypothetical protein
MHGKLIRVSLRPAIVLCAILIPAAGCSKKMGGDVRGTVTLNGKPVTSGTVTLHFDGGNNASAAIGPDGSFQVVKPPRGAAKVTVEPPTAATGSDLGVGGTGIEVQGGLPGSPEQPKTPKAPPVTIPDKYKNVATSGLSLTVTGNTQSFDIPMVGETNDKDPKK